MHPKAVKFLLIYTAQKKQLRYAEKSAILLNGKLGILYVLHGCLKRASLPNPVHRPKTHVIARPVCKLVVAIRSLFEVRLL